MDDLVVYGDFTCPLSRIASQLVDALVARGVPVTWRAVRAGGRRARGSRIAGVACVRPRVHEPPCASAPIRTSVAAAPASASASTFDPSLAISALAALDGDAAHELRRTLFRAHWVDHRNIGDRRVMEALTGRPVAEPGARARSWQQTWEGFADPAVPLVILRTGYVFREAEAIDELARRLDAASRTTAAIPTARGA
jgi:hypothetical protein